MDFNSCRAIDPLMKDRELEEAKFEEKTKPLVSSKLTFKFKAVNRELVNGDDDKHEVRRAHRPNHGVWICQLCCKKFDSGKALGGHMRVHKKHASPDITGAGGSSRKRHLQDLEGEEQLTCSLCPKTFSSPKQLYGHMRCHPERGYRGMIPPENSVSAESGGSATTPSSTIESDHPAQEVEYSSSPGLNLLRCLDVNWSVKKTRRGKSTAIDAAGLDDVEIGAAQVLMLLSTGDNRYRLTDEIRDVKKLKLSSEKPISSCKHTNDEIEDQEDSDNSKLNTDLVKKRKRSDKSVQINALEVHPSNNHQIIDSVPKSYNCNLCNKSYSTPQALGGHKSSSHNKPLAKPTTKSPDKPFLITLQYGGLGMLKPHKCDDDQTVQMSSTEIVATPVSHICKICNKAFPSGQALGGHMRCHWPGPTSGVAQTVVMGSDQSGSSSANSKTASKEPVLGFDLNEPPDAMILAS